MARIAPRPRHAAADRRHRGGRLQRRAVHLRGRHLDVLPPRRQVHGADRRPRRQARRLRRQVHVRHRAAPAVPHRARRRSPAGAQHRVGRPSAGAGRAALVSSLPGPAGDPSGRAPLDGPQPELELHVRRVPLDGRPEALRFPDAALRDQLRRGQRLLRGLSRPRLQSRRVGRDGGRPEIFRSHEGPRRHAGRPPGGHVDDQRGDGQCPALSAQPAGAGGGGVRALPRAAGPVLRRRWPRPAARRQPPGGAPRGPPLLPRRADPRRGLRVRLVPAVQDVPPRRDVLGLPRPAQRQAPRAREPGVPRLPLGAEVHRGHASLPPHGLARRRLPGLPHAHHHLHGRRPAPRPQLPGPPSRPLGHARRAERVHAMPRGSPGRVGGQAGGDLVRARAAWLSALRRGVRGGRRRSARRRRAARGGGPRRRPAGHRAGDRDRAPGPRRRRRSTRPARA